MSIRIDNLLKPFDGTSSWGDWLDRFRIIAGHMKWESNEDKLAYMRLFLEGVPLKIVQQMDNPSFDDIVNRLGEAYAPSAMDAHEMLGRRKFRAGEAPETLWYELCELWRLSLGRAETGKASEITGRIAVLPYYLSALPREISVQLQMSDSTGSVDVLLDKTRKLLALMGTGKEGEVVGALRRGRGGNRSRKCRFCGDQSHDTSACKFGEPVCFKCKKPGHRSEKCFTRDSNPRGGKPESKNALTAPYSGWSNGTVKH